MSRYLILAHETAASPRLIQRVVEIRGEDPEAEFLLLVPATPVKHLLLRRREGPEGRVAEQRAKEARSAFSAAGVQLAETRIGDASPLQAVTDEMTRDPAPQYTAVIISTLPKEQSRWLRLDLPKQVQAQHGVPVIHVQATVADLQRLQQMP